MSAASIVVGYHVTGSIGMVMMFTILSVLTGAVTLLGLSMLLSQHPPRAPIAIHDSPDRAAAAAEHRALVSTPNSDGGNC